jgi:voltage-gated potassium channel
LAGGIGVVLYTATAVAEKVVAGEFQEFFGRKRMEQKLATLAEHFLVCGCGRIGQAICRELSSKPAPFVVIEEHESAASRAEQLGYLVVRGDAANHETLQAAGVSRARGLFAALANDASNIFVTLAAKELNPELFVVARAETDRSVRTLKHAGADQVVSPYAIAGHRMAQGALRPAVVEIIDLATHHHSLELQLEEIVVPPDSPCAGAILGTSGLRERFGALVVALKKASGQTIFNPAPDETIGAGDTLVALAEPASLKRLEHWIGHLR